MTHHIESVSPLSKVRIQIEIEDDSHPWESQVQSCQIEFITGIGSEGLTSFESALSGMAVNETAFFDIETKQIPAVFGYLHHLLPFKYSNESSKLKLKITVIKISKPENREIVKAMAERISCGCGCGCQ